MTQKKEEAAVAAMPQGFDRCADILRQHQMDGGAIANLEACAEAGIELVKGGVKSIAQEFALMCAMDDMQAMLLQSQRFCELAAKMQNNPEYFKTDNTQGYPMQTVVSCMVQARMRGLKWRGNHFNILQGRFYLTKEGVDYALSQMGIAHTVSFGTFKYGPKIPGAIDRNGRQMADVNTVDMPVTLYWEQDGRQCTKELVFNVRMNNGATVENIQGKCKARAFKWLYDYLVTKQGGSSFDAFVDEDPAAPAQTLIRQPERKELAQPETSPEREIETRVQDGLAAAGYIVDAHALLAWLAKKGTPVMTSDDCAELLSCLEGTVEAFYKANQEVA